MCCGELCWVVLYDRDLSCIVQRMISYWIGHVCVGLGCIVLWCKVYCCMMLHCVVVHWIVLYCGVLFYVVVVMCDVV